MATADKKFTFMIKSGKLVSGKEKKGPGDLVEMTLEKAKLFGMGSLELVEPENQGPKPKPKPAAKTGTLKTHPDKGDAE